ncbi:LacI family DNA-binding transcriptional regulator [Pantoea sp. 18069]|uniref:LacI family DNA-binding transcriptional regulator n=1 Tax=Pantoea sp. 18069 TaxID=2681415 RepID=UPI001358797A|nr:LacI family DNA-binding transcriptional regulator [Pantoea sp. 18069]
MNLSRKPATVQDVATLAGVSAMTVSRALNMPGKVTPDTLARVRLAVDTLGYVPNAMASGLRTARARMVAALLPTLVGPVFEELVESLAESLKRSGYQLMIGQAGYDAAQEEALIKTIIQRRPDGIVLVGAASSAGGRSALLASRIPVVETWDFSDHPIDMLVGFSHVAIGESVAEFLHERGHRHVAIITGDDARARTRAQAFIDRSKALGAQSARCFFTRAPSTLGAGRKGLASLIQAAPDISAVFCSSDSLALGAAIEAQHQEIRVPDQLAIVGMGDQSFAQDAQPALTTVRLDGTRIGEIAAELMIARAEGRPVASPVVDVGFHIVVRDST